MKTLLAFLLLCLPLSATEVAVKCEIRKVVCTPYGCQQEITTQHGTGVVIGKTKGDFWVVLTADHVVAGSTRQWIADGEKWVPVNQVYQLNNGDDAAYLTVESSAAFNQTPCAEDDAAPGEAIKYSGYSGGRTHESSMGVVSATGVPLNTATCDRRPRQGQSGGGVYDRHGRLIGIVSGYDSAGNLVYCPIGRVRRASVARWGFFFGMGLGVAPPVVAPPPPVIVPPPPTLPSPEPPPKPEPIGDTDAADERIVSLQKQVEDLQVALRKVPKCECGEGCKCDPKAGCKCDPSKQSTTLQILSADGKVLDSAKYPGPNPVLKLKLVPKAKAQ